MSVKATFVRLVPALGFVMVKVSDVVPLIGMVGPPNALLIDGALRAVTVRFAVLLTVPALGVCVVAHRTLCSGCWQCWCW